MALTIIFVPWIILFAFWVVTGGFSGRKVEEQNPLRNQIYNLLLVIVPAFFLFFASRFSPFKIVLIQQSLVLEGVGIALSLFGMAFAIWARVVLGRNWSADVSFKENQTLISRGPYKVVRHPIYTGFLALILGSALYVGLLGGFVGLAVAFVGAVYKLRQEEGLMMRHFPQEYSKYKKQVKCAIIPYIF